MSIRRRFRFSGPRRRTQTRIRKQVYGGILTAAARAAAMARARAMATTLTDARATMATTLTDARATLPTLTDARDTARARARAMATTLTDARATMATTLTDAMATLPTLPTLTDARATLPTLPTLTLPTIKNIVVRAKNIISNKKSVETDTKINPLNDGFSVSFEHKKYTGNIATANIATANIGIILNVITLKYNNIIIVELTVPYDMIKPDSLINSYQTKYSEYDLNFLLNIFYLFVESGYTSNDIQTIISNGTITSIESQDKIKYNIFPKIQKIFETCFKDNKDNNVVKTLFLDISTKINNKHDDDKLEEIMEKIYKFIHAHIQFITNESMYLQYSLDTDNMTNTIAEAVTVTTQSGTAIGKTVTNATAAVTNATAAVALVESDTTTSDEIKAAAKAKQAAAEADLKFAEENEQKAKYSLTEITKNLKEIVGIKEYFTGNITMSGGSKPKYVRMPRVNKQKTKRRRIRRRSTEKNIQQ